MKEEGPARTVRELMTTSVATIEEGQGVLLALQMMLWGGMRHLPVMSGGNLVGMVSERDLHHHLMSSPDRLRTRVGELMHARAPSVHPDAAADAAAACMCDAGLDALPVMERGELVGIVTSSDIVTNQARRHAAGGLGDGELRAPVVQEVMSTTVHTVSPDASVRDALRTMIDKGIRHLPVVDNEGRLCGMLSDRDIRSAVGDPLEALDDDEGRFERVDVESVMAREPITATADMRLTDLASCFLDERVGAVPVVDALDRVVGIVSYIDVLHYALRGLGSGSR